jgi:hypothetical protein
MKVMWQCSISNSGFVGPKLHRKIYNVSLQARGGQRCCRLGDSIGSTTSRARVDGVASLGRMTMLQVQGWRGVDDIMGSGTARGRWCRGLREDDGVAGSGTAQGRQRRRLGDSACGVDGVTD